jgi:hypothetical protein
MSRNSVFVHSPNEMPKGEHWAIIEGTSVYIPGDERSRTNPGHGYPASTENYITYQAFTDKKEFETELAHKIECGNRWGGALKSVVGIHVQGVYEPKTHIEFTEKA